MMVMDSKNGKTKTLSLAAKNEGGNIYGSDSGKYFASSVLGKSSSTIRVYSTDTGKLLATHTVSYDGKAEYGYKDPIMRVLDKTKTCIILLGAKQDTVKTKIVVFSF
jgi:hypothetical protein